MGRFTSPEAAQAGLDQWLARGYERHLMAGAIQTRSRASRILEEAESRVRAAEAAVGVAMTDCNAAEAELCRLAALGVKER
jgi:hypothetical protein